MGFRNGAYATVWEVRKEEDRNYSSARISISRKNKDTQEYETEFSAWVRMIGQANDLAQNLEERARIKIGECDVRNSYDKEKNVTYTNYAVFSIEMADGSKPAENEPQADDDGFIEVPDNVDTELPWA